MAVLVPSYGRPENMLRLVEAFQKTCGGQDTRLFAVVEASDPKIPEYEEIAKAHRYTMDMFIRDEPERPGMVAALNWGYRELEKDALRMDYSMYEAVAFMGDDHLPKTVDWDVRYMEALDRGAAIVYGNDLLQGEVMPTQVCMDSAIPMALGRMAPDFYHLCIDLVWKDWGEGLQRLVYLPDVIIEHIHPAASKTEWDDNYERVNNPDVVAKDAALYYEWKENQLPRDLAVLKKLYEG